MSITAQSKIGDNLAADVVAIVEADGADFPFPAYGPRSTQSMGQGASRVEIRAGHFARASDQMNQNPSGSWYYNHRRGLLTGTVVSQRHAQAGIGPDSKHAEAVGRFRYLMDITTQQLVPNSVSGYQIVDIVDQGDFYSQDAATRTDRTELRFQIDLLLPPASYTDS